MTRIKAKKSAFVRTQRRESKRRLIAHLVLHGFFPAGINVIAQRDGACYCIGLGGGVVQQMRHGYRENPAIAWPQMYILKALAARAGVGI